MRRVITRSMLFATLAAIIPVAMLAAQARPNVKLGLWETVMTMEGMGPGQPQKLCITAAKLANGAFDEVPNQECKRTVTGSTATSMDVSEACANPKDPAMTGTGTLHIQVLTPESVKGTLATKLSMGGRAMTMNGTFTSKFVSADCGSIK
ncbi:MAG TPA: DUF3617 family protein [Vicinamibacterales bacterium]|nr:DUF3617 family protein [Vicinamibacterales bacterium]